MAGRRQPIELLLIKSKKHLTKTEIEDRQSREIRAPSDKIKAPSYLNKELKAEFNKISKELVKVEIMTNLDVDALARFIYARKMYLQITDQLLLRNPITEFEEELTEDGGTVRVTQSVSGTYLELLHAQDKLFRQCRQSASDLGLTISSRCRLVVPKKEDKKELSKEEKLFGERL